MTKMKLPKDCIMIKHSELTRLQSKNSILRFENKKLKDECKGIKNNTEELVTNTDKIIDEVFEENGKLRMKIGQLNGRITRLKNCNASLHTEKGNLKQKSERQKAKIDVLQLFVNDLEGKLKETEETVKDLTEQLKYEKSLNKGIKKTMSLEDTERLVGRGMK